MDAKTNANIINAVASGEQVQCPNCNTMNEADACFCMTCGTPLAQAMKNIANEEQAEPVFPVTTAPPTDIPFAPADAVKEPDVPFAPANVGAEPDIPFAPINSDKTTELPFAPANAVGPEAQVYPAVHEDNVAVPFSPVPKKRKSAAFAPVSGPVVQEPEEFIPLQPIQNEITTEEVMEAVSAFAEGLPDWDIVPPQVAVRRKKK